MLQSGRAYCVAWVLVLEMAAAGLLAGCGGAEDELPREAVSGTVKLNGQPLKQGRIQFQGTAPGGAGIVDGNYSIPKAEGLVPGKYQVLITSTLAEAEPAPSKTEMPGDTPPPKKAIREPIPEKYNAKSKLAAEVTKGGPNKFDFELTDK
jgi:hypothetical protein